MRPELKYKQRRKSNKKRRRESVDLTVGVGVCVSVGVERGGAGVSPCSLQTFGLRTLEYYTCDLGVQIRRAADPPLSTQNIRNDRMTQLFVNIGWKQIDPPPPHQTKRVRHLVPLDPTKKHRQPRQ